MIADFILCSLWTPSCYRPTSEKPEALRKCSKEGFWNFCLFNKILWVGMQQNLRSGAEGWSGQQISRQLSKMGRESSNQMSPPTLVKQPSSLTLLSLWVWAETLAKVSNKCVSRHRACSGWTGGHSLAGGEACWRVLIAQYCLEKTATEQHSYECCKVVINSLRVVTVKNVLVCWFLLWWCFWNTAWAAHRVLRA